jgi:hypothetical protein
MLLNSKHSPQHRVLNPPLFVALLNAKDHVSHSHEKTAGTSRSHSGACEDLGSL